jgi:hypothetical protein
MKRRLVSLALALAVLCQTAIALAFGPFDAIATCPGGGSCTTLKGIASNPDPLMPGERGPHVTPIVNLRPNVEVYVSTVDDWFRWDPTSTATADDIEVVNPTKNGVAAGRFLRLFRHSPKWLLQNWWISESSGHDENPGTLVLPLKTDRELYRRWGRARIATAITVTYLAAPVGQTNYDVEILSDASLTLLGTPTTNKTAVTITAVTAQVRTGGSEVARAITGATLGAADVGKLAIIRSGTAGNINAYARILKDNGGGSVRVSPFGKADLNAFPAFVEVTPVANTDVIDVVTPMTLSVGRIRATGATNSVIAGSPTRNALMLDSLTLDGNANNFGTGTIVGDNVTVAYARHVLKDIAIAGVTEPGMTAQTIMGGGMDGAVAIASGCYAYIVKPGLLNAILHVRMGGGASADTDTYFQASRLNVEGYFQSSGVAVFDNGLTGAYFVAPSGTVRQGGVADWGAANAGFAIRILAGGRYVYLQKPTINSGLGAGRETLVGGTDKQYAAIPYVEAANGAALAASQ